MIQSRSLRSFLIGLGVLLTLSSCAIQSRKDQTKIHELYEKRLYSQAQEVLEKSSLKKEEKNHLLYLMEKGKLDFAQGFYKDAEKVFFRLQNSLMLFIQRR